MNFITIIFLIVGFTCAKILPHEVQQYYCMQWRPINTEPDLQDTITQEHYDINEKITNQTTLIDVIHGRLDRQNGLIIEVLEQLSTLRNDTKEAHKNDLHKYLDNPITLTGVVHNMLMKLTDLITDFMEWNSYLKTQSQELDKFVECKLESQRYQFKNQHLLEEINLLNTTLQDVTESKKNMEKLNQIQMDEIESLHNESNSLNKTLEDVALSNTILAKLNKDQMDEIESLRAESKSLNQTLTEFQIRLVYVQGMPTYRYGRLEVYHCLSNVCEWGTVCDDYFDSNDANVACRQLGYGLYSHHSTASSSYIGNGKIWLDDMHCSGSESSLDNCSHSGWGNHDCGHGEDTILGCH